MHQSRPDPDHDQQADLVLGETDLEVETLKRWDELDALDNRLAKIRRFDESLAALGSIPEPVPVDLREQVQDARAAYLALGEAPEPPAGPTVADLEEQITGLPEVPTGDTTPAPQLRALWEQLQRSVSALEPHLTEPVEEESPSIPEASSDDLRQLANALLQTRPVWDSAIDEQEAHLRQEHALAMSQHAEDLEQWTEASARYTEATESYRQARAGYEERLADYQEKLKAHRLAAAGREESEREHSERRSSRNSGSRGGVWQLILGALLLLAGLATLVVEPITGAVLSVMGLTLLGWGAVARRDRNATKPQPDDDQPTVSRPEAPVPPDPPAAPDVAPPGARPGEPLLSPLVEDIEMRRQEWVGQAEAFDKDRAALLSELQDRELPADPEVLQSLARAIDEREGARRAAADRRALADRHRTEAEATSVRLLDALRSRGEAAGAGEGPGEADQAYRRYEEACAERATASMAASRREDLEGALASRQSEEAAYRSAMDRRGKISATLTDLVAKLAQVDDPTPEDAACIAARWLRQQQDADEGRQRRERLSSLREQLLDGATTEQLAAQAEELRSGLGKRPETPGSNNLEDDLLEARRTAEQAATRRASAEGRRPAPHPAASTGP